MKPFERNISLFAMISIISDERQGWRKVLSISLGIIFLASLIFALIASILFAMENITSDFEGTLYAIFQIGASNIGIQTMIIPRTHRHKIMNVLNKFQKVYDQSKYKNGNFFYINTKKYT